MSVPDGVVSFLLQNLSRLLANELGLPSEVKAKIRSLSNELKFMDIFLRSSEGKRNNELVKEVVNQIRDVAHKAEDVIDTYVANVINQESRNLLGKLAHFKDQEVMLHDVNAEIENIRRTVDEIYKNKERYDIGEGEFKSGDDEAVESLRRRRRDVEEEEVVGLVHDSTSVINQLMERGSSLKVVSIIGMGGLGKTTLARKIYNDNRVKGLFHCRLWGYVSNEYRAKELLLSLLKCLSSTSECNYLCKKKEDETDATSDEELKKKLRECLNEKKYLVVLDDIWKTEVWDEMQGAFPDDHRSGSRILITSRIKEVASYAGTMPPYYLPFLSNEESWELFSKKVFRGEERPSHLEPLGRSIVESCGGLPLAIIVLAGLVAKKEKSQREWLRIKDHVKWHLAQDKTKVMDILKLSYDSLPRVLKPCFLYFGMYPEDYEINARHLMQQWIVEGFIQPLEIGIPNAPELEDVADNYLDELVDRSLIQVASRRTDGGVKTCRIHDLLLDLCISESKAEKFLEVCTESNINTLSNPRRLSLHCNTQFYISLAICNQSCTRSLFVFADNYYSNDTVTWILQNFKLARVLDFGKAKFTSLPGDLKKLIHLRYLRIEPVPYAILKYNPPDSICCLWNLETLDIRGWHTNNAWKGIWNLKQLRHLYTSEYVKLPAIMSRSDSITMWSLQTLSMVAFKPQKAFLINKARFPKLRKLGLCYHGGKKRSMHGHLQSLQSLSNLRTLKIFYPFPSLGNVFPSNLAKVTLKGFYEFDSITLNNLGRLTTLQILKIEGDMRRSDQNNFDLNCAVGEFPQLQVFEMTKLAIERWRLDKGAMPHLRHLVIEECKYLKELPEELWSLTTFREVEAKQPSVELTNSLQNVEVKNGCKITIYPPP